MQFNFKLRIASEMEMSSFAKEISKTLDFTEIILLKGELGAGKTFISKQIIANLHQISPNDIESPTFTILNEYKNVNSMIHHYDLYRIKNITELGEIGLFESLGKHLHIIEWPQIIEEYLAGYKTIAIKIFHTESEVNARNIEITSNFALNI